MLVFIGLSHFIRHAFGENSLFFSLRVFFTFYFPRIFKPLEFKTGPIPTTVVYEC